MTIVRRLPSISAALVAFLGGLLTPPSLHVSRQFYYYSASDNLNSRYYYRSSTPPLSYSLPPHTPCTSSNLVNYLHANPVNGLHIVCVSPLHRGEDGMDELLPQSNNDAQEQHLTLNNVESIRLTFYKNAHSPPINHQVKVGGNDSNRGGSGADEKGANSIDWQEMRMQLYAQLGLVPEGKFQQPWAVFTPLGERIVGDHDQVTNGDGIGSNQHIMSSIIASGMIIVTQGGNWVWPGVREGFQRTVLLSSSSDTPLSRSRNVTIETLSLSPLVLSIQGFLTDEECEYIAKTAAPTMQYSGVKLKDVDAGKDASNWRTSQSTFLSAEHDQILTDIEHRTASLTRVPRSHQEYVQVLRYGSTEKYDAHHDFFDPAQYQSDKNTLNLIEYGKKNRFATVFWYLTDVEDGGHTIFPRAGGLPPMNNFSDCSRGLKVKPQKGKVIIFYSLDASGARDDLSLHGACPVGEGNVKWAANKWVWNAPMGYITS